MVSPNKVAKAQRKLQDTGDKMRASRTDKYKRGKVIL